MFPQNATYQEKLIFFRDKVTIYPVSCEPLANGRSDIQWLEGVLAGGAKIVQLRDKFSDDRSFYQKALIFREKTNLAGTLFIVNNRVDIALLAGADGVHLGNKDLPAEKVREIVPDMIIGVSCNEPKQAASAKIRGASYFNIGPLYETETKKNLTPYLGSEAIEKFSSLSDLPFTVMGGIKRDHIEDLVAKGARRIAVVTALTQAKDIAAETRCWIDEITRAGVK
ncbi:MAG: thiamine phosphate synthase [Deltaproteobacteria bacterium]|jgi:thiamine-phosphate pyrophosphorylase|nr:thiamine phosphate synthase [Deltaproteobacteria bacterium]